ncbi:MAG: MMPL family transporter [Actinobacteria bacterium]|nr:MMPL family transporter [Actinomycetota bacterium]
MMSRVWSTLATTLSRRAGLVTVVGLLLTLTFGFGASKLTFATGTDSYLNNDDPLYVTSVDFADRFGGDANLTVIEMDEGHTVAELATNPRNAEQLQAAAEKLRAVDGMLAVVDFHTTLEFTNAMISSSPENPTTASLLDSIGARALLDAIDRSEGEDKAAREADNAATVDRVVPIPESERVIGEPAWTEFLLYDNAGNIRLSQQMVIPDERHAMIIARFEGNLDVDSATAATNEAYDIVSGLDLENASVRTTGAPKLLAEINEYLRGGMLTLGAIALGIMAVILLVLFDVRWRLLPLAVVAIGVIWAFGTAGFLGIPLTLVTVAGLPVMLGIGIDYAIQLHARVEEEAREARAENPLAETARNLGPALLVVTFDAVFAFAALHWAAVPMIRDFGLLLAVGVAVICIASIIVPLALLGIREYRKPTPVMEHKEGALGKAVVRMGRLPTKSAVPLIIAAVAIFAGGIAVEEKLDIQSDPVRWVNQDSELINNLKYAEEHIGGSSELAVYLEADDVWTQDIVDYIDKFTIDYMGAHPEALVRASSIVELISDATYLPGVARVTPPVELVKEAFDVAPEDVKLQTFHAGSGERSAALNTFFLIGPGSLEERKVLVDEMMDDFATKRIAPDGANMTPSGLVVLGVGLVENLEKNRILLTYLAISFVGVFLAIRLRSIVRSLLSLVPVLIAVGASSLVAFALDLQLSPMTAVGGPLVVAVCTEFTSLILLRFVEERQRGYSPSEAVEIAASRTGRAFIVSGMTAVAGVATISLSSFPLLRDFGLVVGMNVLVALISALVVLPPMLSWADERGWVTRGMLGHDHHAQKTAPGAKA